MGCQRSIIVFAMTILVSVQEASAKDSINRSLKALSFKCYSTSTSYWQSPRGGQPIPTNFDDYGICSFDQEIAEELAPLVESANLSAEGFKEIFYDQLEAFDFDGKRYSVFSDNELQRNALLMKSTLELYIELNGKRRVSFNRLFEAYSRAFQAFYKIEGGFLVAHDLDVYRGPHILIKKTWRPPNGYNYAYLAYDIFKPVVEAVLSKPDVSQDALVQVIQSASLNSADRGPRIMEYDSRRDQLLKRRKIKQLNQLYAALKKAGLLNPCQKSLER